jgi:hypothetical protein
MHLFYEEENTPEQEISGLGHAAIVLTGTMLSLITITLYVLL